MRLVLRVLCLVSLCLCPALFSRNALRAQQRVDGEIQFSTASKITKSAGVWVDGGYAGRLGDTGKLKVSPGEHEVVVRQVGYSDFTKSVSVEPKAVVNINVALERDTRFSYPDPDNCAELRLDIRPSNSAVFVDGFYAGTADQFYGVNNAMQLIPGKHHIKVAMPGFQTYETDVVLSSRQRSKIRTALPSGGATDADLLIRPDGRKAAAAAPDEKLPSPR